MICDIHGQHLMAHPGEKRVWYGNLGTTFLLFPNMRFLAGLGLASSVCYLALRMFTAKGEVAGMIAGNCKSEAMVL